MSAVLGYFLVAIANIVDIVLFTYMIIVFGAVVISWVDASPYNPIVRILRQATDPVFYFVRRKLPFLVVGMLDLTPFAVVLCLVFLQQFLVKVLFLYGHKLIGG